MANNIYNLDELKQAVQTGQQFKYIYFWGHTPSGIDVDKSCLSQWYPASFDIDGQIFATAEHYMMAEKARLFSDEQTYQAIIATPSPAQAKALGRKIKDFDESIWQQHRVDIVFKGNLVKFSQNSDIRQYLINTQGRVLVEASPVDRIWGMGLSQSSQDASNPKHWQGLNLLGFILMRVRDVLQES